jgi:RNA polymerase-binding transcription factor DksA
MNMTIRDRINNARKKIEDARKQCEEAKREIAFVRRQARFVFKTDEEYHRWLERHNLPKSETLH